MKTKIWQFLILLLIVIIEIIGFSDKFKYYLINSVSINFGMFFRENLIWFKVSTIIILIISIFYLRSKLRKSKIELFFIIFFIKSLQKRPNHWVGLANMLFVLTSIGAISKEFFDSSFDSVLNGIIMGGFMIVYSMISAIYFIKKPSDKTQEPKILITALSLVKEKILHESLKEMEEEPLRNQWFNQIFYNEDKSVKKVGNFFWGPWANLDPIRKSIIVHNASFDEIVLISSKEATKSCNKLPDDIKPQQLITDFLNRFYPNHKTNIRIFSDGTSGNDMDQNGIGIQSIIESYHKKKYKDEDIMFNITGATVAISGAMILKAIPGDRRAEYAEQDTGGIIDVPLSIYSIKELWNELLEKVG